MAFIDIRWVTLIEISWFSKSALLRLAYLPPATKLGQGYVFTGVCDSVHRGGICLSACWDTTPQEQMRPSRHPASTDTPPPPQSMLGDTVNARAVRILLECNLVL